jgi:hypothetical protein
MYGGSPAGGGGQAAKDLLGNTKKRPKKARKKITNLYFKSSIYMVQK